jgi:hypothetical protein
MADELDPPRKFYQLKPTEFERMNRPPGESLPAQQPDSPVAPEAIDRTAPERIEVRDLVRHGATGVPLLGANQPANRANDVHTMLQENLAKADAAGLNEVTPRRRRPSRRKRDYFLLLIPINAFFAFWAFGPWANAVTFVYGIGGIALFTAGLSWVMWGVMDDY